MPLLSRRLDQIIARRRHARPKDRARSLINFGYQIDGIKENLPTTETPYERTPFIYDPYPDISDIPPTENGDLSRNRAISFGTITEHPIDNLPYTHPSGSNFPSLDYPDWNRHAPILLDFFNFIDTTTDDRQKGEVIAEYWKSHFTAPPVEAILQQQLAARAQVGFRLVPIPPLPPVQEPVDGNVSDEDTTIVSSTHNHPSDEDTTNTSDDEGSTPSKRQKRFDHYVPGPCVPCTFNSCFPPRLLNTGIFGTTLLTHLDTSGRQFTLLPDTDYHFNDVIISLDEGRRGLKILAICPEVVDVTAVPEHVEIPTANPPTIPKTEETPTGDSTKEQRKRPYFETRSARTYNTRPNLRPAPTDDSSVSTIPTGYQDPDYFPSDTEEDTRDSDSDNESRIESNATGTQNAFIDLSLTETIDLTQSDTEYEKDSEAGDIIVYNVSTSTENV